MAIPETDLLKVPTIYVWPISEAYFSGNLPPKYGLKYGRFVLPLRIGSWIPGSPMDCSLSVPESLVLTLVFQAMSNGQGGQALLDA